jgi:hypothetical protein
VHRKPERGTYREVATHRRGQRVAIAAVPRVSFRVADIVG